MDEAVPDRILAWKKLSFRARFPKHIPSKRSGHTLLCIGSNAFLFGGCNQADPPGPCEDFFVLKLNSTLPYEWQKVKTKNQPLARWKHSATVWNGKMVVFGGFHSNTIRCNDIWIFNPITMNWCEGTEFARRKRENVYKKNQTSAESEDTESRVLPSSLISKSNVNAPSPRGAHSASLYDSELFIFGGFGGNGNSRRDFSDLFILELESMTWTKPFTKGSRPAERSGHQACMVDTTLYILGGWNSTTQFNDFFLLDIRTMTWSELDGPHMNSIHPRWNHAAIPVMAIPYWKIFVFGGEEGQVDEYHARGTYVNHVELFEAEENQWSKVQVCGDIPPPRSDCAMAFDEKRSRLILFGGWANQWYHDLYALDISCIVGPPYAVTGIYPDMGPITGGTPVTLVGMDFVKRAKVTIRFGGQPKGDAVDVCGTFIDTQTLTVVTPDYSDFDSGPVQVRVAMEGDPFTVTYQTFTFVSVTSAPLCFAFGPGVLSGGVAGEVSTFYIQACDSDGLPRITSGDEFQVSVQHQDEDRREAYIRTKVEPDKLKGDIIQPGVYTVEYVAPDANATYVIEVKFMGSLGGIAGPIFGSPFTVAFSDQVDKHLNKMYGPLVRAKVSLDLQNLEQELLGFEEGLARPVPDDSWSGTDASNALILLKELLYRLEFEYLELDMSILSVKTTLVAMEQHGVHLKAEKMLIRELEDKWKSLRHAFPLIALRIAPLMKTYKSKVREELLRYYYHLEELETSIKEASSFTAMDENPSIPLNVLTEALVEHAQELETFTQLERKARMFKSDENIAPCRDIVTNLSNFLTNFQSFWHEMEIINGTIGTMLGFLWSTLDENLVEEEVVAIKRRLALIPDSIQFSEAYQGYVQKLSVWTHLCPLLQLLRQSYMRERHWQELATLTHSPKDLAHDELLVLGDIVNLDLGQISNAVKDLTSRAQREQQQELALRDLETKWREIEFHVSTDVVKDRVHLSFTDAANDELQADLVLVKAMLGKQTSSIFHSSFVKWQHTLEGVDTTVPNVKSVQMLWSFLEPFFLYSEDVAEELPDEAKQFAQAHAKLRQMFAKLAKIRNVRDICMDTKFSFELDKFTSALETCKLALSHFRLLKCREFPRFYFLSEHDLLDLLSNTTNVEHVLEYVPKLFLGFSSLEVKLNDSDDMEEEICQVVSGTSRVGREILELELPLDLVGQAPVYLFDIQEAFMGVLRRNISASLIRLPKQDRLSWLMTKRKMTTHVAQDEEEEVEAPQCFVDSGQTSLVASDIHFVKTVELAFEQMTKGYRTVLHEVYQAHVFDCGKIIAAVQSPTSGLAQHEVTRMINFILLDIYRRDVLARLLRDQVMSKFALVWQHQMKARMSNKTDDIQIDIGPLSMPYGFDYLGNAARLVMTPLTDRIFVTTALCLHHYYSSAPSGVAESGKTETMKLFAANVGKTCWVFNLDPSSSFQCISAIIKGVAALGAWCCLDEFNRLPHAILSMTCHHVLALSQAKREELEVMTLDGQEDIPVDSSGAVFLTMNVSPGALTHLPKSLTDFFRPMVVSTPDTQHICETLFLAHGFQTSQALANIVECVFHSLTEMLCSSSHAYVWGLRQVRDIISLTVDKARELSLPTMSQAPEFESQLLLEVIPHVLLPQLHVDDLEMFHHILAICGKTKPHSELDRKKEWQRQIRVESPKDNTPEDEFMLAIHQACGELEFWPDEDFCTKVAQLDSLHARHQSLFVIGPPGCGKSSLLETLGVTYNILGNCTDTVSSMSLNPKLLSATELFGYVAPETCEWHDGWFTHHLRSLNCPQDEEEQDSYAWLVLDGVLDPSWVESMNSLLDDNQVLTLASNERLSLAPHVRLVFESTDLSHVGPATVTRGGVCLLSTAQGRPWRRYVGAWISRLDEASEEARLCLSNLLLEVVEPILGYVATIARGCPAGLDVEDLTYVQTLCRYLNAFCDEHVLAEPKRIETWFVYAAIWAFGATLDLRCGHVGHDEDEHNNNGAKKFTDWWKRTFANLGVQLPKTGTVFEYWLNPRNLVFQTWSTCPYYLHHQKEVSLSDRMDLVTIPTVESAKFIHWAGIALKAGYPVVMFGASGVGKTRVIERFVHHECVYDFEPVVSVYCSALTRATDIQNRVCHEQNRLNQETEEKQKKTLFFIDDLSLCALDTYDTPLAHCVLRTLLDTGVVYDTTVQVHEDPHEAMSPTPVRETQFLLCMNPLIGHGKMYPRLQRHCIALHLHAPSKHSLMSIYQGLLNAHVEDFSSDVRRYVGPLLNATMDIHRNVALMFRKSPSRCHYEFNLKQLSSLVQGMLQTTPLEYESKVKWVQLWIHEVLRSYGDALTTTSQLSKLKQLIAKSAKTHVSEIPMSDFLSDDHPLIFCNFGKQNDDDEDDVLVSSLNLSGGPYDQIEDMDGFREFLKKAMIDYDQRHPKMNLHLFDEAIVTLVKICRILGLPHNGHMTIIGQHGMGKKSLCRFASFLMNCQILEPSLSLPESESLKKILSLCFQTTGIQKKRMCLLFEDTQMRDPTTLNLIHSYLHHQRIPNLFSAEEHLELSQQIENVYGASNHEGWELFYQTVQQNFHIICCYDTTSYQAQFQSNLQTYPALVSGMHFIWVPVYGPKVFEQIARTQLEQMDWLEPKLQHALVVFSQTLVVTIDEIRTREDAQFGQEIHHDMGTYVQWLLDFEHLYLDKLERLNVGMNDVGNAQYLLVETLRKVETIEENIRECEAEVEIKTVLRSTAQATFDEEHARRQVLLDRVELEQSQVDSVLATLKQKQKLMDDALAKGDPILATAHAAIRHISKKAVGERRLSPKLPTGIIDIYVAVQVLFVGLNPSIPVDAHGKVPDRHRTWPCIQSTLLANVNQFLNDVTNFENVILTLGVPDVNWNEVRPYMALDHFDAQVIQTKDLVAAELVVWMESMLEYHDVIQLAEPKRQVVAQVTTKWKQAVGVLEEAQARVAESERAYRLAEEELEILARDVEYAQATVDTGKLKLELTHRLDVCLSKAQDRWTAELTLMQETKQTLVGDVLLASAAKAYFGGCRPVTREWVMTTRWIPFLRTFVMNEQDVALAQSLTAEGDSDDCDNEPPAEEFIPLALDYHWPEALMVDVDSATQVRRWSLQQLPPDRAFVQNAAIFVAHAQTSKWPLVIDPDLQMLPWLHQILGQTTAPGEEEQKNKSEIHTLDHDEPMECARVLELAIEKGHVVILTNIRHSVHSFLFPVLSRTIVDPHDKDENILTFQDKQLRVHADFRLVLHSHESNPTFHASIQAKVILIQCHMTESLLALQLEAFVLERECGRTQDTEQPQEPECWSSRERLEQQQSLAQAQVTLARSQQAIVQTLTRSTGEVSEKQDLVVFLEEQQRQSVLCQKNIRRHTQALMKMSEVAETYQSVVRRGTMLFGLLSPLARMLQSATSGNVPVHGLSFSVNAFKSMFIYGLENAPDARQVRKLEWRPPQRFSWTEDWTIDEASVAKEVNLITSFRDEAAFTKRCDEISNSITKVFLDRISSSLTEPSRLFALTYLVLEYQKQLDLVDLEDIELLFSTPDPKKKTPSLPPVLAPWLPLECWTRLHHIQHSKSTGTFTNMLADFESSALEWHAWMTRPDPESEPFPKPFERLIFPSLDFLQLLQATRPDRMVVTFERFVDATSREHFQCQPYQEVVGVWTLEDFVKHSTRSMPIVLESGYYHVLFQKDQLAEVTKQWDVEVLSIFCGQSSNSTTKKPTSSLGEILHTTLRECIANGHWLCIQNLELLDAPTCASFIKDLSHTCSGQQANQTPESNKFRCFISYDAQALTYPLSPQLLRHSLTRVLETPNDFQNILSRSWSHFTERLISQSLLPQAFQSTLFHTTCFYTWAKGRQRFGTLGWHSPLDLSTSDLRLVGAILSDVFNHPETGKNLAPCWSDLCQVLGQFVLGRQAVEFEDTVRLESKLAIFLNPDEVLNPTSSLIPDMPIVPHPEVASYKKYATFIQTQLARLGNSAQIYGLAASLDVRLVEKRRSSVFWSVCQRQFSPSFRHSRVDNPQTENIQQLVETLASRLPEFPPLSHTFDDQLRLRLSQYPNQAPLLRVCVAEAKNVQKLNMELHKSLEQLQRVFQGTFRHTPKYLEDICTALRLGQVPHLWQPTGGGSGCWKGANHNISRWFQRLADVSRVWIKWTNSSLALPPVIHLSSILSPRAFILALKHTTALSTRADILTLALETHVTVFEDPYATLPSIDHPAEGIFVSGLSLLGARWQKGDEVKKTPKTLKKLSDCWDVGGHLSELMFDPESGSQKDRRMPVLHLRAIPMNKNNPENDHSGSYRRREPGIELSTSASVYNCPVVASTSKSGESIFAATLATSEPASKWSFAGVALVLDEPES